MNNTKSIYAKIVTKYCTTVLLPMKKNKGPMSPPLQLPNQIVALSGTRFNNNSDNDRDSGNGNGNGNGNKKAKKKQPLKSFPWKLYLLLERCEYENTNNKVLVEWLPDNKSFVIYNEGRFAKEILSHFCLGNNTTTTTTATAAAAAAAATRNKNNESDNDSEDGSSNACATTALEIFQTNLQLWYVLLFIYSFIPVMCKNGREETRSFVFSLYVQYSSTLCCHTL